MNYIRDIKEYIMKFINPSPKINQVEKPIKVIDDLSLQLPRPIDSTGLFGEQRDNLTAPIIIDELMGDKKKDKRLRKKGDRRIMALKHKSIKTDDQELFHEIEIIKNKLQVSTTSHAMEKRLAEA